MVQRVDVTVMGASSVTAREVMRYLDRRSRELGTTWAAAGRDDTRVQGALDTAGVTPTAVLIADVTDQSSLDRMARATRVVVNLVGPYGRSADAVMQACIAAGVHYLDLSGETPFLRRTVDRFDVAARRAGVKIVQPCGFEALPFDLLMGLAREQSDVDLARFDVELVFETAPPAPPRPSDAISSGTMQSLLDVIGEPSPGVAFDPALLIGDPERAATVRRISPLRFRPRRSFAGGALAPLVPVPLINPPVMHRSAELLGWTPLRYREGTRVGGPVALPAGLVASAALSGAFIGLKLAGQVPVAARRGIAGAASSRLPAGLGPRADRVEPWRWRLEGRAETVDGGVVSVRVAAKGHPGYGATAHMIAEAGLILAEEPGTGRTGVLTPLAALGTGTLDRFSAAGLTFTTTTTTTTTRR